MTAYSLLAENANQIEGCLNGGRPLRVEENNQYVICAASSRNICPDSHECVSVNAKGSIAHRCCPKKGFANIFNTPKSYHFSTAHICSLPPQQGNLCAKTSITRWYFNIVTKVSIKYIYIRDRQGKVSERGFDRASVRRLFSNPKKSSARKIEK